MKPVRCDKGHLYDAEQTANCPLCRTSPVNDDWQTAPAFSAFTDRFAGCGEAENHGAIPNDTDRFLMKEELGKGSISQVYRVLETREMAMKVIPWRTDQTRQSALREFQTAKQFCECEQIVSTFSCFDRDRSTCILMEKAIPWKQFQKENPVDICVVIEAAQNLCRALHFIHEKGYSHYDVNPQNILFRENKAILGDFSHCFPREKGKPHSVILGTGPYIAPEIIERKPCSGLEDIYSLGITLHYLLTDGRYPFYDSNRKPVTRRKDSRLVSLLLHPDLAALIDRATAYDPADRFPSAEALLEALDRFAGEHGEALGEVISLPEKKSWEREVDSATQGLMPALRSIAQSSVQTPFYDPTPFGDACTAALPDDRPSASMPMQEGFAPSYAPASFRPADDPANERTEGKTEAAADLLDEADFSVFAEKTAEREDRRMITIYMYTSAWRETIYARVKEELEDEFREVTDHLDEIRRNAEIRVLLTSEDIKLEENDITRKWNGKYLKFSFDYLVPDQYPRKQIGFRAKVYVDGLIVTTLPFTVGIREEGNREVSVSRTDITSAYLSYARKDLAEVTFIVQTIRRIRPGLDLFFDVENLQTGEHWEPRLYQELSSRDALFLCWSRNAAQSDWVTREWEYFAEKKGVDAIEPFPLESPELCPVPEKLQNLHFNSLETMIRSNGVQLSSDNSQEPDPEKPRGLGGLFDRIRRRPGNKGGS